MSAATASSVRRQFDCYGLRMAASGDWPEVLESIELDLAWFSTVEAAAAQVEVAVERRRPDFDAFGEPAAAFITPRNVVYQQGGRSLVDYFGRALLVYDRERSRATIQGEDEHLVHEAAYHFLTSRMGEHLDRRGLTRLHGLGLSAGDGAVVVMLPSGGGKSTLALRALDEPGVKLVSEDTPLVDRRGVAHPFVLRIGVNATDAARLPAGRVRRIERMEFHPKLALEVGAFADRIESSPLPLRHVVIGRRTLGRSARLERLPRRSALVTLFREAVVGVGVYQGMEFVLQRGLRDTLGMAGIAASRSASCLAALARARTWRLTMGRDHERNWEALRPLLGERP